MSGAGNEITVSGNDVTVSGNDVTVSGNDAIENVVQTPVDYDTVYQAVYDANVDTLALQEVTDGQSINSTALTYFTGILENMVLPVDYVAYVGDSYQYSNGYNTSTGYEYCLVYGDLTCSGTHFTGDDCALITMRTTTNERSVEYETGVSVDLTAPLYYSRSNLGTYSGMIQYPWIEFLLLILGMIGGLVWLLRKVMRLGY